MAMTVVYEVNGGLYVNLTNRCPCACRFCIRTNGEGAYGSDPLWLEREPTQQEVIDAIEAANPRSYAEIVFCGYGEPTERIDDLVAVARHLKARYPSLPIRLNTNGLADLIAGEPTAQRFKGCVDVVSISLNASTAEAYCEICRPRFGLRSYGAMLDFTAQIRAFVPEVVMSIVATSETPEAEIAACREICGRLGVPLRVRTYISSAG
jgi:TatD family-associated radical SAM protein